MRENSLQWRHMIFLIICRHCNEFSPVCQIVFESLKNYFQSARSVKFGLNNWKMHFIRFKVKSIKNIFQEFCKAKSTKMNFYNLKYMSLIVNLVSTRSSLSKMLFKGFTKPSLSSCVSIAEKRVSINQDLLKSISVIEKCV